MIVGHFYLIDSFALDSNQDPGFQGRMNIMENVVLKIFEIFTRCKPF